MIRLIFSMMLCCCLSSCGFHLRGTLPLPPPLQHLYVKTQNPYGELTHHLCQQLTLSGVDLVQNQAYATSIIDILSETTEQQLLSVNGTQQTRQYNLILRVTFQMTDPKGHVLMNPETLQQSRTLPINSGLVLGGSNEAIVLFQQMRQDIVFDIINRISSQDIIHLLTQPD